jgi:hypothetical protein
MDEKLLNELIIELKKMQMLRNDYALKNADNGRYAVVVEACDNMINHVKRAIARTIYSDKISILKESVYCMAESMLSRGMDNITTNAVAEQVIFDIFCNLQD